MSANLSLMWPTLKTRRFAVLAACAVLGAGLNGCRRAPAGSGATTEVSYYLDGQGETNAGPFTVAWWCDPGPHALSRHEQGSHIHPPTTVIVRGPAGPGDRFELAFEPAELEQPPGAPHQPLPPHRVELGLPAPGLDIVEASSIPERATTITAIGTLRKRVRFWDELLVKEAQFHEGAYDGRRGIDRSWWRFAKGSARSLNGLPCKIVPGRFEGDTDRVELDLASLQKKLGARSFSVGIGQSSAGPDMSARGGPSGATVGAVRWSARIAPRSPFFTENKKFQGLWVRYFVDFTLSEHPFEYRFTISGKPIK